jgi:hypothetical protein
LDCFSATREIGWGRTRCILPLRTRLDVLGTRGFRGQLERLHDYTAEKKLGSSNGHEFERAYQRWTVIRLLSQRSMASVAFYLYHTVSPS